jgi:hypothetical protein
MSPPPGAGMAHRDVRPGRHRSKGKGALLRQARRPVPPSLRREILAQALLLAPGSERRLVRCRRASFPCSFSAITPCSTAKSIRVSSVRAVAPSSRCRWHPTACSSLLGILPPEKDGRIISGDDITGQLAARARAILPAEHAWQADQALRSNWVSWQASERYVWAATESDLRGIRDRIEPTQRNRPGHSDLRLHAITLPRPAPDADRVESRSDAGRAEASA